MSTPPASTWTLTARWFFPISGLPIERGRLLLQGEQIVGLEANAGRRADVDLGEVAVLPGFVNAHTHLDLTGLRGQCPPGPDFTGWLRSVIAHRRRTTSEQIAADTRAGLAESLRSGTTLLGDISGDGSSWEALVNAPGRAVVFREILGLEEVRAAKSWTEATAWFAKHPATPNCRPGLSPHAPYSVRPAVVGAAVMAGIPAAIHLAESSQERELLGHRRGPFVPFLRDLGAWAPDGLADDAEYFLRLGKGRSPVLFVHGNYLPPDVPIPANGTVVYCPRTHAAFGHSPHPFRDFLTRGVRVALGTDSLASNPDLGVLGEVRFLHRRHPDLPGDVLLRLATLSGAEALGWDEEVGSLVPGKSADLAVVPLAGPTSADPYGRLLASEHPVSAVLIRGRWVHPPTSP
jgi:cytosine/adenosine deaminase-related metal-dependent hydrolase